MPDSASFTLVIVDTVQIQPYIFGSNRLVENIGASYLVAQVTGNWALQAVVQVSGDAHNIASDTYRLQPDNATDFQIENSSQLQVEVLYANGGNFVALFRDVASARQFTTVLSEWVVMLAPGLQIIVHQQPLDWSQPLAKSIKQALGALRKTRSKQPSSSPLAGLGVTMMCRSTALPAVGIAPPRGDTDTPRPASAEILAKIQQEMNAQHTLRALLPVPLWENHRDVQLFDYPRDFDRLGRSHGESSYIAVVHADGNGMGKAIESLAERFPEAAHNRDYISTLRSFSYAVAETAREALVQTIATLVARIEISETAANLYVIPALENVGDVELYEANLPIRPLVFGGDDVTFVCDGRLGVSLALLYLENFEQAAHKLQSEYNLPESLSACAGVAIVKTHYPFARAYALSEALCQSAKAFRRQQKHPGSAIDWYIASSGVYGALEQMRRREFMVEEGSLSLRPLLVGANTTAKESSENNHRQWKTVDDGLHIFRELDTPEDKKRKWAGRRNKIKALHEALRGGPATVKHFLAIYNEGQPIGASETGWSGNQCMLFDALELNDLYIDLSK